MSFNGNCEEAFNFYRSVFGGAFQFVGRYNDLPPHERRNFAEVADDKIMHISLPIAKDTILMGCDSPEPDAPTAMSGNNVSLSINTESKSEADRIFNGLSNGGKIRMSMNETFWGSYFGDLTDKFGIHWMISFDLNEL